MFENLFLLVKSNAGEAVVNNPLVPKTQTEAVINDATSSIIEVLKKQLESGRLKDMIRFFQEADINSNAITTSIINRFANKLNNFYNIHPKAAIMISANLIRPALQQMVQRGADHADKEFGLSALLSKLSGGTDLSALLNNYMAA